MLLNFDIFLSRRKYVDGSKFYIELWPRVKIPRWIMTPGQNSTLHFHPNPRSQFKVESWLGVTIQRWIQTWGRDSTWNQDLGHNSTWNHDPVSNINVEYWPGSQFNVELWPGVTFRRGIMTRGHNSTLIYDPGSKSHVELWPGSNSALNCDPNPGSQFNVESWFAVKIQRGIMTWVHNSTWNQDPGSQFNRGPNFIRRRGRNTMTPWLGGRGSTWKIRWILRTARWIKTPRVEI